MTDRLPLAVPHLGGNELAYLAECIETNYVSAVGPFVSRFEAEFATAVGSPHAVACSSGTSALHVALRLAGAKPDTVVAVSSFTFIASINAITYTGATPLLVDSEPESWNMDTELLHDEVVRRADRGDPIPSVVEIVHILGHPARLEPLLELRNRYGITIVEDAAESLGATYTAGPAAGRQVGTIGDFGCFSFNGNKIITTGNGGMIVTADEGAAKTAKHLTTQARIPGPAYLHDDVGYNYRLSNLASALGVAQLEQLEKFLAAKRQTAARYAAGLHGLPVTAAPHAPWADPSFWLYSILLDDAGGRDAVLQRLVAAGIESRPLWPPVHLQQPYRHLERIGGDVGEDIFRRGLSLPSSVGLGADDIDRVVAALAEAL